MSTFQIWAVNYLTNCQFWRIISDLSLLQMDKFIHFEIEIDTNDD